METALENENILNVTLVEPKLKHSTIFARFDELISGESLVLHNDMIQNPYTMNYLPKEVIFLPGNIWNKARIYGK